VLQGSWHVAVGPEFRPDALQELKAGIVEATGRRFMADESAVTVP
jgi:hypothetical protein